MSNYEVSKGTSLVDLCSLALGPQDIHPPLKLRLQSASGRELGDQLRIVEGILFALYMDKSKGNQKAFTKLLKLFGDLTKETVDVN